MTESFNGLTPAQAERLALLAEECGEVIHVIGKILRHGYESRNPKGGPTNRKLLEKELGDLSCARAIMASDGDVNQQEINRYGTEKMENITKYLHHNPNIMNPWKE